MLDPTPPGDLDVWILAGQSNMQGCGLLREAVDPDQRVWNFSSAGKWGIASEPLHRLWESFTENHPSRLRVSQPLSIGKSNAEMAEIVRQTHVSGAGLGLAFGIALAEKTGRPVGLIPCAHGGTSLNDWSQDKKSTLDLYGGLLERAKVAGGNLRGILWYQGEAEAVSGDTTDYSARLKSWITALRADLDEPYLPLFVVQLGRFIDSSNNEKTASEWDSIREIQRLLPEHIPHCHVTTAIDLGLTDPIHLDSSSLVTLGHRLSMLAGGEASPTVSSIVRDREEEQIRGGLGIVQICCNEHGSTWKNIHPLSGFSLHDESGTPHPSIFLIQAEVAINDPTAIRLVLTEPADGTLRVAYGQGLDPYCNVVDERGLALLAFRPQPVEG